MMSERTHKVGATSALKEHSQLYHTLASSLILCRAVITGGLKKRSAQCGGTLYETYTKIATRIWQRILEQQIGYAEIEKLTLQTSEAVKAISRTENAGAVCKLKKRPRVPGFI